MKLRSASRAEPEVNLTSLIDVVLLLLVFFMITTSFVRESQIAIRLPEADARAEAAAEAPRLEVSIGADGAYRVNGRALVDARPATLRAAILTVLDEAAGEGDAATISADARATHQSVVTAMDVLGGLGVTDISIATVNGAGRSD